MTIFNSIKKNSIENEKKHKKKILDEELEITQKSAFSAGVGVAGGSALLALAGPIGLSIAGATLLTSIILLSKNKGKINKEKRDEIEKIKVNTQKIAETSKKIKILLEENKALNTNIFKNYKKALYVFNKNYKIISDEDKLLLGSIVNETKAIAKSIEKGIDENE